MNVAIPDGWHEIPLGQPVFHHDLEWDRKTKGWKHVTRFGDYQRRCKRRYTIRENVVREDLMRLLRYFPSAPFTYNRYKSYDRAFLMAHILWLAGVETVSHSVSWTAGKREIENIQVSPYSLEVTPYITLPCCANDSHILWHLLRKAGIDFSGGGRTDNGFRQGFAQASWTDKEGFISKVVMYFNAIKNEFTLKDLPE